MNTFHCHPSPRGWDPFFLFKLHTIKEREAERLVASPGSEAAGLSSLALGTSKQFSDGTACAEPSDPEALEQCQLPLAWGTTAILW